MPLPPAAGQQPRRRRRQRPPLEVAAAVIGLAAVVALSVSCQTALGFQPQLSSSIRIRRRCGRPATAMAAAGGGDGNRRICVIGGGAAGFMAAIEAGRGVQGLAGAEVVLVEGTKKVCTGRVVLYLSIHLIPAAGGFGDPL
jgi:hypothetical protein